MRPIDQKWFMFCRDGLSTDGKWRVWPETGRWTRRDCIDAFIEGDYAGATTENDYRNLRRRGVVRCARATLWADLPEEAA